MFSLSFAFVEATHHAGADVEVAPATYVLDRNVKGHDDAREQRFEVALLDRDLDVDIEVIPETDRVVVAVRGLDVVEDVVSARLDVRLVEFFQPAGGALAVFSTNVEREVAVLAAARDQPLAGVEIAFIDNPLAF